MKQHRSRQPPLQLRNTPTGHHGGLAPCVPHDGSKHLNSRNDISFLESGPTQMFCSALFWTVRARIPIVRMNKSVPPAGTHTVGWLTTDQSVYPSLSAFGDLCVMFPYIIADHIFLQFCLLVRIISCSSQPIVHATIEALT